MNSPRTIVALLLALAEAMLHTAAWADDPGPIRECTWLGTGIDMVGSGTSRHASV